MNPPSVKLTKSQGVDAQYEWKPQADITTHELAQCLLILLGGEPAHVESANESIKRHFEALPRKSPFLGSDRAANASLLPNRG